MSISPTDHARDAHSRGRAEGFAISALALGALSFIQLLGTEKAVLTIVLAILALRAAASPHSRTHSRIAIGLGVLYLVITITALILFRDRFAELIRLLQSLG